MKAKQTTAIVLTRTNFQEADRILTVLTPDYGKLRLMAKGVRRVNSKLAGGIELFSVSQISFIQGRGEIGTLISTRLTTHYGEIVKHIDRTTAGYELIRLVNKVTEDAAEQDYFDLLQTIFHALNEPDMSLDTIWLWAYAQLLRLAGHSPNVRQETGGHVLRADGTYRFSLDDMAFSAQSGGLYDARHIKLLRLALSAASPQVMQPVQGIDALLPTCVQLCRTMLSQFVRI